MPAETPRPCLPRPAPKPASSLFLGQCTHFTYLGPPSSLLGHPCCGVHCWNPKSCLCVKTEPTLASKGDRETRGKGSWSPDLPGVVAGVASFLFSLSAQAQNPKR